jgi:hypothetical protein
VRRVFLFTYNIPFTLDREGGEEKLTSEGVNISIPFQRGKKRETLFIFCTVSGIRLLHIGFQIDECAKSLTGPFSIWNGWGSPRYRRSAVWSWAVSPPPQFSMKEKKKANGPMFEL